MQSKIKKLTYINCDKDGHESQPLSRICVEEDCSNRTLICSLCQELSHKGHNTLPLKTYLNKLYTEHCLESENINPLYYTHELDQTRNSFFTAIAQHKRELLDALNNLEVQGKMYFNRMSQEVLAMMQVGNPLEYITQERVSASRLKEYFKKINELINFKDKEKFSIEKKLAMVVDVCRDKTKKLEEALAKNKKQLDTSLMRLATSLDENLVLSMKNPTFMWSESLKGHKIKLNDAIAEQTGMESSGQRFILMEPSLSQCGMKKINWGIKVKKFVGWIGIGICLKNIITKSNYHFNYNNIGHGSYLISSNGYCWSHSVKQFNSASKTFHFNVGDTVFMEYDPVDKKIRYRKNQGNEKFELTIVDPPPGDEYHPCANICSNGDTVEIINPGIQLS